MIKSDTFLPAYDIYWLLDNLKNLKMGPLYNLKFSFNRCRTLSITLMNIQELTLLGLIIATQYSGFYSTLLEIWSLHDWLTYYFFLSILMLNIVISASLMLTLVLKAKMLRWMIPGLSAFIKLFPYLLSVAGFNLCFIAIFDQTDVMVRLAAISNLPFFVVYLLLHEFINESLKFREEDYCNRKVGSIAQTVLVPIALLVLRMLGPFYACICVSLRSAYELLVLFGHCEYYLTQQLNSFYALFTFYFSFLIFLSNFDIVISNATFSDPHVTLIVLMAGALASWLLSKQIVAMIWRRMLGLAKGSIEQSQGEAYGSDEPPLAKIENQIQILVQVFLEREKYLDNKENHYDFFWREFSQIVFQHKLKCEKVKCFCRGHKRMTAEQIESQIFIEDLVTRLTVGSEIMSKEVRLKVINIYLLTEIARKPLKGYYQLILLKKQKSKTKLQFQIDNLVSVSRECFDKIFFKNKVQNQQLNMLKSIRSEEIIKELQDQMKQLLVTSSTFLDIFAYSTLKMGQVETEATKLTDIKKSIEKKLQYLVEDCYENASVLFTIFVFYRYLEPYRSRQNQFKKAAGKLALKKRLLLKAEGQSVAADNGIIYIDLVEERGKIKKITRNIGEFFGHAREDMVGFNINLFMPTIFGRNHARFLSNFIDKGRIKLLKEKERIIFAKNKKKFIFPINIRLKVEHLLDNEFGASAMITAIDTSSEYFIIGKNGRIEDITEELYLKIFKRTLREEVNKVSKLCAYKILPGLNQIVEGWQQNQASKIYEGLLIYPTKEDYLYQKFRHTRESNIASTSRSKSSSLSLVSSSSASINLNSQSERFQYFSQLFKAFLLDINPSNLKAFKVSYKYCRVKTAEFQVELVQVLSSKEELTGVDFLRQLLIELTNLAEIYQLIEQQSPLSQHLYHLEEDIQNYAPNQDKKRQSIYKNKKDIDTIELQFEQKDPKNPLFSQSQPPIDSSANLHISDDSFEDVDDEDKNLVPVHQSQTGSVTSTAEGESKKQLLINAFNVSQDSLPRIAIVLAVLAIVFLLIILVVMTIVQTHNLTLDKALWHDSSYILKLQIIFEYRLALAQIIRFGINKNLTIVPSVPQKQQQLNLAMVNLAKKMIPETYDNDVLNSPYSFATPLTDPAKNIVYHGTIPETIGHLSQLFTTQTLANNNTLRYNYEGFHKNFTDFFNMRNNFYKQKSKEHGSMITALLSVYEVLIGLVALSSIPIYIYFKKEEIAVRSKLAYMNQREVKRSINKLVIIMDYFRDVITKSSITKLKLDFIDKKYENNQELSGSKVIKISSEEDDFKVFSNPWTYCLLIAFIVFFSNLSISLFVVYNTTDTFFLNALDAHKEAIDLEIKIPMLVNVYLSNLNRALQNTTLVTFSPATVLQAQTGYYNLITTLSLPQYSSNTIAQLIKKKSTSQICQYIACSTPTTQSLQDICQSFKHKFDFWSSTNNIAPTPTMINNWVVQNNINSLFDDIYKVLTLSIQDEIIFDETFNSDNKMFSTMIIIMSAVLIPVNLFGLIFILRKYLLGVNQMVRSAQELYMQFPVQVLVQNTYLTSYFNAKIKAGK